MNNMTLRSLAFWILFVSYMSRSTNARKLSTGNSDEDSNKLPYYLGTKDMILLHTLRNSENSLQVHNNKLFSRNSGKFVRITEKKIDGMGKADDKDAVLQIESVGFSGQMRLLSPNGSYCLCLSDSGNVKPVASKEGRNLDRCMFYELQSRGYAVFMSKINKEWYLGITKRGKTKSAKKTNMMQRATHFLKYS